jgi:hypothetical protein
MRVTFFVGKGERQTENGGPIRHSSLTLKSEEHLKVTCTYEGGRILDCSVHVK